MKTFSQNQSAISAVVAYLDAVNVQQGTSPILPADGSETLSITLPRKVNAVLTVLRFIANDPPKYDEKCAFSKGRYGGEFDSVIDALKTSIDKSEPIQEQAIDDLYMYCFAFLKEFEFRIDRDKQLSFEASAVLNNYFQDIPNLIACGYPTNRIASQLVYAAYVMPSHLLAGIVHDKKLDDISTVLGKLESFAQVESDWNSQLEEREQRVVALKEKLETYETGFNFVGLYAAFQELAKKKQDELRENTIARTVCLAISLVIPLLILALNYKYSEVIFEDSALVNRLIFLIPFITVEVLAIYFYRVTLIEYKSLKAQ